MAVGAGQLGRGDATGVFKTPLSGVHPVESPGRPSGFERPECELVRSIQEKNRLPLGRTVCHPWCAARLAGWLLV